jgi:hypothetical protein
MNRRLQPQILVTVLLCGILFFGCQRSSNIRDTDAPNRGSAPILPKGTVIFRQAGVSLIPDNEWDQLNAGPFTEGSSICLPVLKGLGSHEGSIMRVFVTQANADVKSTADVFATTAESDPNTVKGTLTRTEFSSVQGIRGVQMCYDYRVKNFFHADKLRDHIYLFQNNGQKCVLLHYITYIDRDSTRVDHMIKDTLRLN